MKGYRISALAIGTAAAITFSGAHAQSGTNNVRLFQNYYFDAVITGTPYIGGRVSYADYDSGLDVTDLDIFGGITLNPDLEIEAQIGHRRGSNGTSESGLKDAFVTGRYMLDVDSPVDIAIGSYVTLPIGKEEVFQDRFDVGVYAASRYAVSPRVTLTGNASFHLFDGNPVNPADDSRYSGLQLGAGMLYGFSADTHLVVEAAAGPTRVISGTPTAGNAFGGALSAGLDHNIGAARVRGALVVGTEDSLFDDVGLIAEFSLPL
ncbi:hypothetical protein K8B33_10835 [Alcanivorax sp. JB21]|uniref:hypothetical protein n=1 Tax=Alcanivorax limicola TaxID=2874102 RepID=UPI001CBBF1FE|nr:hypothetical protein [Alcanivorax limicola]MBZ2189594.1 hypothetical protein [Alcanivorax limicola]